MKLMFHMIIVIITSIFNIKLDSGKSLGQVLSKAVFENWEKSQAKYLIWRFKTWRFLWIWENFSWQRFGAKSRKDAKEELAHLLTPGREMLIEPLLEKCWHRRTLVFWISIINESYHWGQHLFYKGTFLKIIQFTLK